MWGSFLLSENALEGINDPVLLNVSLHEDIQVLLVCLAILGRRKIHLLTTLVVGRLKSLRLLDFCVHEKENVLFHKNLHDGPMHLPFSIWPFQSLSEEINTPSEKYLLVVHESMPDPRAEQCWFEKGRETIAYRKSSLWVIPCIRPPLHQTWRRMSWQSCSSGLDTGSRTLPGWGFLSYTCREAHNTYCLSICTIELVNPTHQNVTRCLRTYKKPGWFCTMKATDMTLQFIGIFWLISLRLSILRGDALLSHWLIECYRART